MGGVGDGVGAGVGWHGVWWVGWRGCMHLLGLGRWAWVGLAALHRALPCPPHPPPSPAPGPPLQKHTWTKGLSLRNFDDHRAANERLVGEMKELSGARACTAVVGGSQGASARGQRRVAGLAGEVEELLAVGCLGVGYLGG